MIFTIILTIAMIFLFILLIKNEITCKHQNKIVHAIYLYGIQCIKEGKEPQVDYRDMEDYDKTLFRLWDWGYTNILPKEKFEIIKPYINKE